MSSDTELLKMAYKLAIKSPDPSTQNAAFLCYPDSTPIEGSGAVNRFPIGVEYKPERWERPAKYSYIEHAERNCIFKAAQHGRATSSLTMVRPWAACVDCARAIIQAGIVCLIRHKAQEGDTNERWDASISVADEMLHEAGVVIVDVQPLSGLYKDLRSIRRNGELWQP